MCDAIPVHKHLAHLFISMCLNKAQTFSSNNNLQHTAKKTAQSLKYYLTE